MNLAPVRLVKATAPKYPPLGVTDRAIKEALMMAVSRIQDQFVAREVVRALERNDIQGAIDAIRFEIGEDFLMSVLPAHLRNVYELAGVGTAAETARQLRVAYSFNMITPEAMQWLQRTAGKLITEWGRSSRRAIAELIVEAFREQIPLTKLAKMIRDTAIGLTSRQRKAISNLRRQLKEAGYTGDKIDGRLERYYKQLLRYRSEMIARTEMARASVNARLETWRQMIARGLLDPHRMQKEWVATNDRRVCPECEDLDGSRASVPFGEFVGDGGTYGGQGPPQHPQCRCKPILVMIGSKKTPRARVNIPGDKGIRKPTKRGIWP